MTQPLVSIILPTYNGARFLRQSVDSCLKQTYRNIELIIVNDCSTDETPQIADNYAAADNRVKVIHNARNLRLPASLNTGFAAAAGTYFTWTSDDNYYAPEAIAQMVAALEQQPDADLVYSDYTDIDEEGKIVGVKRPGDINASRIKWIGCGACFLYKAAVHERNNGYNIANFLVEDYDFFLRASLHSKFIYLQQPQLYFYRLHPASLTGTSASTVFELHKILVERYIPQLLPHLGRQDRLLLYRKYAVHYAVNKSNTPKMNYYLGKLYSLSRPQTFVTAAYIIFRKFVTGIQVSVSALLGMLRLLLRGAEK